MSDLFIVPPVPYREDGWEVIQKSTGRTVYCGLTFQRARAAVERKAAPPVGPGTPDGVYTVAVDLHGTLAQYHHGDYPAPIGDPLPGAKEAMQAFKDAGYRTVINSVFDDRDAIREWLDKHGIPCAYINESPWGNDTGDSGKIDADVYIDDRGLHFNGDWDEAARKVDHRARHEVEKIAKRFVRKSWANVISEAAKNGAISELEAAADHAVKSGIDSPEKLTELSTVLNAAGGQVLDPVHYHAALEDIASILSDRWWNKAYEDMHAAGPSIGKRKSLPVIEKITRNAFLFLEPPANIDPKDHAQCVSCRMFVPKAYAGSEYDLCIGHGSKVEVGPRYSCGFYLPWPKGSSNPSVIEEHASELRKGIPGSFTPEESGLVEREVRCENCAHEREGATRCHVFNALTKAMPEMFDLNDKVSPHACCNAQTAKPKE